MVQHDQPVGLDGIGVAFDDERAVADAPGALGRRIHTPFTRPPRRCSRRPAARIGGSGLRSCLETADGGGGPSP